MAENVPKLMQVVSAECVVRQAPDDAKRAIYKCTFWSDAGKLPPSKDGGFPRLVAGKPGVYQAQLGEILATMEGS